MSSISDWTYKFTCMCGRVYRNMRHDDVKDCKCGAVLYIKPRAANCAQPMVRLPDSIDATEYIRNAKNIKAKLECEK